MQTFIAAARQKAEEWQKYFAQKFEGLKASLSRGASSVTQSAKAYMPKLDWHRFSDWLTAAAHKLGYDEIKVISNQTGAEENLVVTQ